MRSRWWKTIWYKPYWRYVVSDIIIVALSAVMVLTLFPLSTQIPFQKYGLFSLLFAGVWLVTNYLCHRYWPVKYMKMGKDARRLLSAAVLTFGVLYWYMWWNPDENLSVRVLWSIWLMMMGLSVVILVFKHAYRYALDDDDQPIEAPARQPQTVKNPAKPLTDDRHEALRESMVEKSGEKAVRYLEEHLPLYSTNTFTFYTSERYNIQKLPDYRFDVLINFMPLNQIRGVNKMFTVVNDKLPDDGLWVCCYEPQSVTKKQILNRYPLFLNWLVYIWEFFYRRVLPKLFITSRLYFDITEGKDRVLSKAEVLGRLCYCGFEIVDEKKIGTLDYVIARRKFRPEITERRLYGLFVKLNRVGKDGKVFKVYKFRTMHPYSEFLQSYIYEKYSLQEGGKFSHDIRVTTWGHIMRKCWMDEWPMWLNVLKGDMKIVGVRPLSKQYFSLYCSELQQQRTHHKPGLLPPFYADMPKTLDEIQASEMRYLTQCEQKGTFRTDVVYFWKILYTILLKRARSN